MDIYGLKSGAIIRHPEKGLILGHGPFTEAAEVPAKQTAFYVNTFDLSDPKPWKIPSKVEILDTATRELPPPPFIEWREPTPDAFAQVFTEIIEEISAGRLNKCVPATPQFGKLADAHSPLELIQRAFNCSAHHYPYAWWDDKIGFCGATPEVLFHQQGNKLTTMALAGTARPEDESVFINDEKEIREHEIVVRSLISRLSPHGSLTRKPRSVLNLGTLIHFISPMILESDNELSPNDWLRILHPTPALGPQPRTEKSLSMLADWRRRLRCPSHFGAPFGFQIDGQFLCLVGIRSMYWNHQKIALCSGGGIVASSTLTQEWRELKLKRETIKRSFSLI